MADNYLTRDSVHVCQCNKSIKDVN